MNYKKIFISGGLALNIGLASFLNSAVASKYDYIKKDAYGQLAEVLYNPKYNIQFQIEILERMAEINGIETNFKAKDHQYSILSLDKDDKKKLMTPYSLDEFKTKNDSFFVYLTKSLLRSDELAIRDFSAHILDNYVGNNDISVFIEMLKSDNIKEREIAIKELSDIQDIKTISILLNYYKAASLDEKKLISSSLSNFKDLSIINFFENELKNETDFQIIVNSAIILVNNKQSQYLETINNYLFSKNLDESRYTALKLRDINAYIDLSIIESLSNSTDNTIKIGILSFLDKNMRNYYDKKSKTKLLKILNKYISDKTNLISYSSIKILSEYPNNEINKILKPLLYTNDSFSVTSNYILTTQNKYLIPSIIELTKFKEENVKFQAAKSLSKYGKNTNKIYKELFQKAEDPYIRLSSAIELYVNTNNSTFLEQIINNEDSEISNIAVLYLAEADKTKIYKEKLKIIVLQDKEEINRLSAALILLNNNDYSGINIIKNYLLSRKGVNINSKYMENRAFLDFLNEKDEWIQLNSAYNLSKINNVQGINKLKNLIKTSKDERIRTYALFMLGLTGDMIDIKDITQSYNDEYTKVRANAALAVLDILSKKDK